MISVKGRRFISLGGGEPPVTPPTGTKMLIIGDSVSTGTGADWGMAYQDVYTNATGIETVTQAAGGRTLQILDANYPTNSVQWLINNESADYAYDADFRYALFMIGGNDVEQQTNAQNPLAIFNSRFKAIIAKMVTLGWPIAKIKLCTIGLINPAYPGQLAGTQARLTSFNTEIKSIGTDLGIQIIDINARQLAYGGYSLLQDQDHLNNSGHAVVGNYLAIQLP